ncbi:UDP-galactose transporter Gms1 [Purpureocillium takamizusanense]|uniref:UDP-galactose transporter Gms1 n=1 Tax=Purpureocillium takamizusanense TaxID=2060973 RepID=A0A9Q8QG09_9HYPO|nr:UDP-galactose transporter Gms1 [Purpureocillium takamizusanense]UNI17992.1 UDP-galactose transporter Gms1 [Purpureocillium takamizusanense]
MAILQTTASRGGGGKAGGAKSLGRNISLITLTFQNSALILIMHYSRVMPPSGDHRYFTSTAVFLNEVIKLGVALTLAIYEASKTLAPSTPATILFEQIYNAVFSADGWQLAMPAAFYTLQNLLQYVAVENLDPVHFQVLYQIKILTTAIFSVFLLRRQLGLKGWVSLIILTLGVSVVSLPSSGTAVDALLLHGIPDHYFPRSKHELGQAAVPDLSISDTHLTRRSATYEGIANDLPPPDPLMNYSVGVTAAVVAAVVSGLAGVYFEKLLKESPTQASVWVRNVQLSFYSLIAAFFGGVIWQDGAGIREHGFFEGYNGVVWAAVVLQAAGGLIASLVIRDADNIVKNFATSISIVISFVVSVWAFKFTVTLPFLVGTALVLAATYLYSVPERSLHRPPPMRIASFEKPAIEKLITPASTPRTLDPPRLNLDPFDAKGLGVTSSRPSSPMLARQKSRTHLHRES